MLNEYLKNPCRFSSIPHWKSISISLPSNMRIVHDSLFHEAEYMDWQDTVYFRLFHPLTCFSETKRENVVFSVISPVDIPQLVEHINACYNDLKVSIDQMLSYTQTPVYTPQLWIFAKDAETSALLGSGIADYDAEAGELMLEWIQVHPAYRGKGIGQAIVNELLKRRPSGAIFATVSGKVQSASKPEKLYRKCGFIGSDYWHILTK